MHWGLREQLRKVPSVCRLLALSSQASVAAKRGRVERALAAEVQPHLLTDLLTDLQARREAVFQRMVVT